jgi:lysophospholipase L1-like esterase
VTRSRRIEALLAALTLAFPVLLFATDLSAQPDLWRFSYKDLMQTLVSAGMAAGFLLTYRIALPRHIVAARSVLVVSMVTLLGAFLVGELVLRAMDRMPYEDLPNIGRHVYDEDLGHVYEPNYTQVLQTREWRQEWRSNTQGVRADRDFGPKPEGVTRILMVGDSFTVGDQVAVDDTYPGVLQRLLDESHGVGRFEVVNAGFPAYGTVHEAGWLEKFGARFEPDVVLLGMTPNDLLENQTPRRIIGYEGGLVIRGRLAGMPAARDRQRWYNVRGHLQRSKVWQSLANLRFTAAPYLHRRAFMLEPDSAALAQYDLARGYVREARAASERLGARFAFFTIPFLAQLGDLGEGLDAGVFGSLWAEFARAEGIPFVDILPDFEAHPDPASLYWVEDMHCTAEGYEVIGRAVYDLVLLHSDHLGIEAAE